MNLDSAKYVLTTTRTVRKRLDLERPVSRQVVEECLEIGLQAPNGSNLNTWRWVIVDDRETIRKIAALYRAGMNDHVASLGANTGANYKAAENPEFQALTESVQHFLDNLERVPMVAFPLMAGRPEGASVFDQASMWGSSLQSVWSFFLALRTKGMGSAWTTVHLWREREFADLLGIPVDKYTQVGMFPIAYTVGLDFKAARRKPVNEVLCWNSFAS